MNFGIEQVQEKGKDEPRLADAFIHVSKLSELETSVTLEFYEGAIRERFCEPSAF